MNCEMEKAILLGLKRSDHIVTSLLRFKIVTKVSGACEGTEGLELKVFVE